MDFPKPQNFQNLNITGEVSLEIKSCGIIFKRQIDSKSGYQFMPLTFSDFLKFTTYSRRITEWAQNAQNAIECLDRANKSQDITEWTQNVQNVSERVDKSQPLSPI